MQSTRNIVTKTTFLISLIVVLLMLAAVIFPAIYHSSFGNFPTEFETPFELGHNATLVIIINIVIFGFGFIYYKNKFPLITTKIDQIRTFEISKKVTLIVLLIILGTYTGLSSPELFLDESQQWGDYLLLEDALRLWPDGKTDNLYVSEQLDRYVRMGLLSASQEIFQNIKILPFFASILVVFFTYLLTVQLTSKRFAGIIAMLVLLQSHLFLTFDTIAVYENFWVLFYMISLLTIKKGWMLSPIFYILSVFTKAFVAPFFVMTLYSVYRSEIEKRKKYYLFISYFTIIVIALFIIIIGATLYTDVIEINPSKFFTGFADTALQFRYDIFFVTMLLPVVVGLYVLSKHSPNSDIIHALIAGTIIFGPILVMSTYFYEILAYRYVPTLVFFSIGIGLFFAKKSN